MSSMSVATLTNVASEVASSVPWPVAVLGALGMASACAAYADAWKKTELPNVQLPQGSPKELAFHQQVLSRCPSLQQPYQPIPFLTNRHVETIFAAKFRKTPEMKYIRECLLMPDGGCVALDWEHKQEPDQVLPADAPILLLLPGLTGGSHDSYVVHAVQRAARSGMRAVVFNSRATSDSPVTTPQYYSASFTGDMRAVVAHVHQRYPRAPLLAAGWSLGANILVRYLGEEGPSTPVCAAVSMCNPFELTISNEHLTRGFNRVYDANLATSLKGLHAKHAKLWVGVQGKFRPDLAATCRTIREFDDAITIHSFGWPSVEAYYAGSCSAHSIPNVAVPLLCIQALDDPIAPQEAIPYQALAANPLTLLVTTPTGGHLGWCTRNNGATSHPWTDEPMMEWFQAVLEQLRSQGGSVGPKPVEPLATLLGQPKQALLVPAAAAALASAAMAVQTMQSTAYQVHAVASALRQQQQQVPQPAGAPVLAGTCADPSSLQQGGWLPADANGGAWKAKQPRGVVASGLSSGHSSSEQLRAVGVQALPDSATAALAAGPTASPFSLACSDSQGQAAEAASGPFDLSTSALATQLSCPSTSGDSEAKHMAMAHQLLPTPSLPEALPQLQQQEQQAAGEEDGLGLMEEGPSLFNLFNNLKLAAGGSPARSSRAAAGHSRMQQQRQPATAAGLFSPAAAL